MDKVNEAYKSEAKNYFNTKAFDYYSMHYGDVNNKKKYPSLYLRHQYILKMLEGCKGKVLDIGCGAGIMVKDLLDRGFSVHASDFAPNMVEATKEITMNHQGEVSFSQEDIEGMSFNDNEFDYIVCAGVLEYLSKDDKALDEVARVLKPNGTAIITVPNKLSPALYADKLARFVLPKSVVERITTFNLHREHNPRELEEALKKRGLVKEDFAYFHFYPIPVPFDRFLPKFSVSVGKKMERWSKSRLGILGTGHIIKVRKRV
tara:strand:+ start:1356 stop:2138 length:783 start_codon:yes stop_codon:yes gene_type:complete